MQAQAQFQIAAGSVRGTDHALVGRNNQDAFAWATAPAPAGAPPDPTSTIPETLVLAVADGCSEGAHSEVGARIGVRSFVQHAMRLAPLLAGEDATAFVAAVNEAVLADLRTVLRVLGMDPAVLRDHLLFTLLGSVVTPGRAVVLGAGDGLVALNGVITVLEPEGEGNRPGYLGYALLPSAAEAVARGHFTLRPLATAATEHVQSLVLATDGASALIAAAGLPLPGRTETVGPFEQFWTDEAVFRNPDAVRRRLSAAVREVVRPDWASHTLRRESGLLPDDTTLVALRRAPAVATPVLEGEAHTIAIA